MERENIIDIERLQINTERYTAEMKAGSKRYNGRKRGR